MRAGVDAGAAVQGVKISISDASVPLLGCLAAWPRGRSVSESFLFLGPWLTYHVDFREQVPCPGRVFASTDTPTPSPSVDLSPPACARTSTSLVTVVICLRAQYLSLPGPATPAPRYCGSQGPHACAFGRPRLRSGGWLRTRQRRETKKIRLQVWDQGCAASISSFFPGDACGNVASCDCGPCLLQRGLGRKVQPWRGSSRPCDSPIESPLSIRKQSIGRCGFCIS